MSAADTIEVRLRLLAADEPIPVRALAWAFVSVLVLIGLVLSFVTGGDFIALGGMRRLQLVRRATGEVLVDGGPPAYRTKPLLLVIRRDAERLEEAELLAKWGEPREWRRLLDHERY